jgi:hypothetical protein
MMIKGDETTGRSVATGPKLYLTDKTQETSPAFDYSPVIPTVMVNSIGTKVRAQLINPYDREPIATTRWRTVEEDFLQDVSAMARGLIRTMHPDGTLDGANLESLIGFLYYELSDRGYCDEIAIEPPFLSDEEADAEAERRSWTTGTWEE